jgi:hypothetical protein
MSLNDIKGYRCIIGLSASPGQPEARLLDYWNASGGRFHRLGGARGGHLLPQRLGHAALETNFGHPLLIPRGLAPA